MVFVPSFEHDIFVSYAQVDNDPVPGVEDGWVTCLVKNLEWRLRQLCGRRDAYSLWMDRDLARHVRITPAIFEALENTAVLLVVLSPGYLASDWCRREREAFLGIVQRHLADEHHPRVFVVARDKVDRWPPEFGDLLGYQFWTEHEGQRVRILGEPKPNPELDKEYFNKVWDLASDVYGELSRLRALSHRPIVHSSGGNGEQVAAAGSDDGCSVYLAEATDDLDLPREQVRRHLEQYRLRVLPEKWYSRDPDEFRNAVQRDLEGCTFFVQLLSGWPGKRLPGSLSSYVVLQYQYAMAAGKPILQWRSPTLDMQAVADGEHRALLEGSTVMATDLETFKREVVAFSERASQRERPRRDFPGLHQPFVFVNIGRDDLQTVDGLCEAIVQHGCTLATPLHEGRAEEIRRDLEENLLDCDGLIVVYGSIPESWVRQQLREWRKMLYRRHKPLRALAVYEGPPPEAKRPLGMRLPDMQIIDCRQGLNEQQLQRFFAAITAGVA